jgi:hypoxanthine phosphoribosyltransferase
MEPSAKPILNYIPYEDFLVMVQKLARRIGGSDWIPDFIIGIGRGGLVPAVFISHQLQIPMLSIDHSSKVPGFADELLGKVAVKSREGERLLFVDDINDSGGTILYIRQLLSESGCDADNMRFAVLVDNGQSRAQVDYKATAIDRNEDKHWFVFPWESVIIRDTLIDEARAVPERLG